MLLLTEFLLRLAFGLALGMALVSPRQVTSGYFRNHLFVTMGLALLAVLLTGYSSPGANNLASWCAAGAAAASYLGSVGWLYEKPRFGKAALVLVAILAYAGSFLLLAPRSGADERFALGVLHMTASGGVLGLVTAAMLLGHWYLNAPGMALAPLRRLLVAAGIVVVVHAAVCATGLAFELQARSVSTQSWMFVALRWLFGLAGVVILIAMAWRTLDIPNTQSATGILYVAVIGVFVGETVSLLLSAESVYPL